MVQKATYRESDDAFRARIKAEGRWDDFVASREQLIGQGHTKAGAHRLAKDEFPPTGEELPKPNSPDEAPSGTSSFLPEADAADFADKSGSRIREDIEWVYASLGVKAPDAKACPSPGAWALLRWARRNAANQTEFYRTFVSKLLPSKTAFDLEDRALDETRDLTRTIAKLLAFRNAVQSPGSQGTDGES